MSTKIYNGYRIGSDNNAGPDVFTFLEQLRAALNPLLVQAYATTVALLACAQLDAAAVPANPGPDPAAGSGPSQPDPVLAGMPALAADQVITEARRTIRDTGRRDPVFDLSASVTFLRDENAPTGPLYALLYTERADYTAAFLALPGVDECGYWNNTDRPEHVSDEEWDFREQLWARLIGRDAPTTRGLSWDLFGDYPPLDPITLRENIVAALPTRQQRAVNLARARVTTAELVDGRVRMRPAEQVRAELRAEADRIEPLLSELTDADLYPGWQAPPADR